MSRKPQLRRLADNFSYHLNDALIVGRHVDCDIVLSDERGASRKHARFSISDNDVYIMDLGSLNGTLVNGREIESRCKLVDGDRIIFDANEYEVLIPETISEHATHEADNITVIANQDEAAHPKLIKSAIRKLEDSEWEGSIRSNHSPNDATQLWDDTGADASHSTDREHSNPRHLGDEDRTILGQRAAHEAYRTEVDQTYPFRPEQNDKIGQSRPEHSTLQKRSSRWLFVGIPLSLMVILALLAMAYKAGLAQGTRSPTATTTVLQ